MADRFVQQASAALSPAYTQSATAVKKQIPAIQQLYNTLFQGLEAQGKAETQNILESASSRGVLRSSLPIDLQTTLGQALIAERGKLGAQQAGDIAQVRSTLGQLSIDRVKSIRDLAERMRAGDLSEREFKFKVKEANRNFKLAQQELAISAAKGSGGGGGGSTPKWQYEMGAISAMAQDIASNKDLQFKNSKGQSNYLSPESYKTYKQKWITGGLSGKVFDSNFGHLANPSHLWDYGL